MTQLAKPSAGEETPASFDRSLRDEQLALLYRDSTTYYRLGMGCALVCCSLLWHQSHSTLPTLWLLAYSLLTWGGITLNKRYRDFRDRLDALPKVHQQRHWQRLFTLGGLLVGGCWGVLLVLLVPQQNALLQSVALISVTGLALYASAIFSALLSSYVAFVLPALIPFIVQQYYQPEPLMDPTLALVFLGFLLYSAWRNHLLLKDSLRNTVRNHCLLQELTERQQETDQLIQQLAAEVNQRDQAEQRLQQAHDRLEEQIHERTQELSASNARLQQAMAEQQRSRRDLERNRQRYIRAMQASHLGLWEWDLASDQIHHSHFEQLFGYSEQEIPHFMGHLQPLVHEQDYPLLRRAMISTLKGFSEQFRVQFRIRHKSGQWRWLEDVGRVIERDPQTGRALKMIGTRRDISDQVSRDQKLRLAWQAFESSGEAIFALDGEQRITTVNDAFTRITGYSIQDIEGLPLERSPLCQQDPELKAHLLQQLNNKGCWEGELIEQRKNGDRFPGWLKLSRVAGQQGEPEHFVGIFSDLTQRKKAEEKLSYLANYDDLTGVANRNLFKDRLHLAISQALLNRGKLALILLDIDRFKIINNTLGHDVGDQLLRELAERLGQLPEIATIARLGADEFALILEHYEQQSDVEALAEQICQRVHTPVMIDDHELIVSCSMGISLFPKHSRGLNILVNQADLARNKIKQQGGAGYEFYNDNLQSGSVERLQMESDLRKALLRDELCVYYQPKVCLKTNRIYEAEALVRWNHPEAGLICPGSFIPIAEETALISALGEQVFVKSCQQLRQWLDQGLEIKLSVNLSAQQLLHHDLVGFIDNTIRNAGLPHHLIELELTESSLIDDPEHSIAVLQELRALGITLAIDDFGTGYSSLSYLQRFPLDILKIDRSFLKQVTGPDPQQATLTKAIIALGQNLEMKVVAEGVETRAQLEFLQRNNCDFAQGFHISPPVPPQTFYELVERHNNRLRQDAAQSFL